MMVSTIGSDSINKLQSDPEEARGKIEFLMRNRHGTPFEHNSMTFLIEAPIFVFREWHRHRVGWCLAADTEVWCETWGLDLTNPQRTVRKRRIDWLWYNWHEGVVDSKNRVRMLESCRNLTVRTLDESTQQFILSKIVGIHYNGVKSIVRLRTETGEFIECSADHQFYTPDGWTQLKNLNKGDLIAVNGRRNKFEGRQLPPSLRSGIGVWTSMQRNSLISAIDFCRICDQRLPRKMLVLDHIVPVISDLHKALDVSNLQPICIKCHRQKTDSEQILARRGITSGTRFVPIKSIIDSGKTDDTYDLELEGPNFGFVANGIVVHNSYNEMSARYKQLEPVFYIPSSTRKLVQHGKPGRYNFTEGNIDQITALNLDLKSVYSQSYLAYEGLIERRITKEIARACLPVGIYSAMWATCNARSLMHFLSLRTKDELSTFPSFPMEEIEMCARQMENIFAELFPITHSAFCKFGRVAP